MAKLQLRKTFLAFAVSAALVCNAYGASSCDPINQAAQSGAKKETDRIDASDTAIKNGINATKNCMIDFGAMSGSDISSGGFNIGKSLQSYLNKAACDYATQVQSKIPVPNVPSLPNLPNLSSGSNLGNLQSGAQNLSNTISQSTTNSSNSSSSVWDRLSSALTGK
jgi:hypothetical protein